MMRAQTLLHDAEHNLEFGVSGNSMSLRNILDAAESFFVLLQHCLETEPLGSAA